MLSQINVFNELIHSLSKLADQVPQGRVPPELYGGKTVVKTLDGEYEIEDEKGFWSLIPSPRVDSDIRVLYWYTPTYIATAVMMAYYLQSKSEAVKIAGFEEALKKGLEASTGRNLNGHGSDDISGRLEALEIFAKGLVIKFIDSFNETPPRFSSMITEIVNWLRNSVNTGNTKGGFREDYSAEMEKILKMLTLKEEIIVFVYGTLMKGRSNHKTYLAKSEFMGSAVVEGYELYDLGSYPGVICSKAHRVKGELYKCAQRQQAYNNSI